MKTYRLKHAFEALRWIDTDAKREEFATWFDKLDRVFETRGAEIVLGEENLCVAEGKWVVFSGEDHGFLAMDDAVFHASYRAERAERRAAADLGDRARRRAGGVGREPRLRQPPPQQRVCGARAVKPIPAIVEPGPMCCWTLLSKRNGSGMAKRVTRDSAPS